MKSLSIFVLICLSINIFLVYAEKSTKLKKSFNKPERKLYKLNQNDGPTANPINQTEPDDQGYVETKIYQGNCFAKIHDNLYNLFNINSGMKSLAMKTTKGDTINYNICHNVHTNCSSTSGLVVDKAKCISFAGHFDKDKNWTVVGKKIIYNF